MRRKILRLRWVEWWRWVWDWVRSRRGIGGGWSRYNLLPPTCSMTLITRSDAFLETTNVKSKTHTLYIIYQRLINQLRYWRIPVVCCQCPDMGSAVFGDFSSGAGWTMTKHPGLLSWRWRDGGGRGPRLPRQTISPFICTSVWKQCRI